MYYCIDDCYALRSWDGSTCCLLDRETGSITDLPFTDYQILTLLDGKTAEEFIPPKYKSVIQQYIDKGCLKQSSEPLKPMDDWFRLFENRCMPSLYWSITGKCNYQCRHCYIDAPDGCYGECTTAEALDLVNQIVECGIPVVSLSGGEPLVRNDFWEIVDALIEKRIIIDQIYTNGQLVDETFLYELKRRNMRPILCFSFDGLGWHDWMRGTCGAENAAINAMKLCKQHQFPFIVSMCIHKGNVNDLKKNIDFISEIGALNIKIGCVSPTELWKKNAQGNELSSKELLPYVLDYIPDYYQNHIPMQVELCPYIRLIPDDASVHYKLLSKKNNQAQAGDRILLCGATRHTCYVSPDLRLIPCMPMASTPYSEAFPSLRNMHLKDCLNNSLYLDVANAKLNDLVGKNDKCAACKDRVVCGGGCRACALTGKDQSIWGCDYDACYIFENGINEQLACVADAAVAKYRNVDKHSC